MNRMILRIFVASVLFVATTLLAGCEVKEPEYVRHPPEDKHFVGIFGLNLRNFPRLDSSTSARELALVSAYKLLGLRYQWSRLGDEWSVDFLREGIPDELLGTIQGLVQTSGTHSAFTDLIDGKTDVILTDRAISPDEQAHAAASGVTLLLAPIAIDGVPPTGEDITDEDNSLVSQVHVAVRSGIPHGSMTMQLFEWFQTERARSTIEECGFLPKFAN